jgi:hypothetical protein
MLESFVMKVQESKVNVDPAKNTLLIWRSIELSIVFFVESSYLARRRLSVSEDQQPCYGVTRNEDWWASA